MEFNLLWEFYSSELPSMQSLQWTQSCDSH